MTLGQIKQKLVYYFQQTGVSPGFLQDTDDMILVALNEARKQAELIYAFEVNRKIFSAPAVTSSFSWAELTEKGTANVFKVRNLKKAWYVGADGKMVEMPLEYRNLVQVEEPTPYERKAYIVGTNMYVYPALDTLEVVLDGYAWMAEYEDYNATDWMVEHGGSYLFWACVQDLNHRFKEFVPRQEGNLTIGKDQAQEELQRLIVWDNQLRHGFFNGLE